VVVARKRRVRIWAHAVAAEEVEVVKAMKKRTEGVRGQVVEANHRVQAAGVMKRKSEIGVLEVVREAAVVAEVAMKRKKAANEAIVHLLPAVVWVPHRAEAAGIKKRKRALLEKADVDGMVNQSAIRVQRAADGIILNMVKADGLGILKAIRKRHGADGIIPNMAQVVGLGILKAIRKRHDADGIILNIAPADGLGILKAIQKRHAKDGNADMPINGVGGTMKKKAIVVGREAAIGIIGKEAGNC
jgi:RNase P/RNase MRP subunit p29